MSILDAFTGAPAKEAAKQASQRAMSTGNDVDTWWGQALSAGLGQLGDARDQSLTDVGNQEQNAQGVLNQFTDSAHNDLTAGYGTANGYLSGIQGLYAPYAANGQAASGMLANATGLNGAAGNAAATGAFQASPGYDWQVSQAADAAARKQASLGIAGSGNTLDALSRLGSNLANTEYQQWLSNLGGQVNTGLTATAGQAAGLNAQGQLANTYGQNSAALDTGQGSALAGLYSNLGSQQASINTNAAQNAASLYGQEASGVSNANVGLVNSANQAGTAAAQQQMAASSNALGALFGGARLLAGGIGGSGGLSSLFGGSSGTSFANGGVGGTNDGGIFI